MHNAFRRTVLLASVAGAAMTLPLAAQAQSTGAAAEAQVGEVVVTAQRREQRLQDAPVAVTALSSESLEQLNVSDSRDLMTVVPSLQVSPVASGNSGSATFFLRGMGQLQAMNGSDGAVGIYIDDFYYPSIQGAVFSIMELERVEVLRGPQGTLFGRNTIGGAIRYTTRAPTFDRVNGNAKALFGSRDRRDLTGTLNVPIGEKAALRLTAGHLEQDGYVRVQSGGKDVGGTETNLVRLQARVEPMDTVLVDLALQYSKDKNDGIPYNMPGPFFSTLAGSAALRYNNFARPRGLPLLGDQFVSQCFYCQAGTNFREFSNTEYSGAFLTAQWEFAEGFTLKSLTSWQDIFNRATNEQDGTPLPIFGSSLTRTQTQAVSQELQLNGHLFDDRLIFVSGVYYLDQEDPGRLPEREGVNGGVATVTAQLQDRKLKSLAGYVDGSFDLTENLRLLGGFRYSQDEKSLDAIRPSDQSVIQSESKTFKSNTYRVGLQYSWSTDIMTYANIATGFRSGGFNPYNAAQRPAIRPFDPEKAITYEAGARMQFLDRRVTINPTVFHTNWEKIQVQSLVPDDAGLLTRVLFNAGEARSYGAELEWVAKVTQNLRLFGSVAYLDIKYTDVGQAEGITLQSKLQRAPKWTFAAGAAYTHDLASGAKVTTTLNYNFQDEQRSIPSDSDGMLLPSYDLLNGRIEYRNPTARWRVGAYVSNLLDEKYFLGGIRYTSVAGPRWNVGPPREVGVSLSYEF